MKIEDLLLVKQIIEGAIMVAERPLSRNGIKDLFDELECPEDELLDKALEELQSANEERAFELVKVASGYRYQVKQELSRWTGRLWKERAPRYSRALLETLSLIAYRQPITRGEIENIRGVAVSSQIIKTLLEREWVKVVGHRDVPGRPAIYATTKQFLDYFNLSSLDQLPPLAEIRDLSDISKDFNIDMPPELLPQISEAEGAGEEISTEKASDEKTADDLEGTVSAGGEASNDRSEDIESSEQGHESANEGVEEPAVTARSIEDQVADDLADLEAWPEEGSSSATDDGDQELAVMNASAKPSTTTLDC